MIRGRAAHVATQTAGVLYSVLAGIAIANSTFLITIYGRGGELSYVFPVIYGGDMPSRP
jgi:hypothetical protein